MLLLLQIHVGPMEGGRIVRGSRQVVTVAKNAGASAVLSTACCRLAAFNKNFDVTGTWELRYPDGSEVMNLPGTTEAFTLIRYREELMKDYQKIVLYVSPGTLLLTTCINIATDGLINEAINTFFLSVGEQSQRIERNLATTYHDGFGV